MDHVDETPGFDQAAKYQIIVQGRLDESWSEWLDGMTLAFEHGVTTLTGTVADQSALRGVLSKIWDLNLTLISVDRIEANQA